LTSAEALWIIAPGRAELRPSDPGPLAPGQARVRAWVSGISRGTESLVFHGRAPRSEWDRMRCPFQEGDFPFPIKYGYAMLGRVEAGPDDLVGQRVFSLYPHQSLFNLAADALIPAPDDIPDERCVLAPQMETALNATWDAGLGAGDRVAVVGGGVIGLLVGYLCARTPGVEVALIDVNPRRRALAQALGVPFAEPGVAAGGCDLVFHASATAEGLNLALSLAGFEGQVIELSWFGDRKVDLALGGAFHSQRLALRASQVGSVAPARRARWDHRRRLAKALDLCADPRLDVLVREQTPLADMPDRMAAILADPDTLCHLIRYR
jgi:NADPH:quinone reductase-like Zn-dependent oxidoreductase